MGTHSLTLFRISTAAIIACATMCAGAWAEEPVPTALNTSDAQAYVGAWTVAMDVGGRVIEMSLDIVDLEGKIGITLDSPQMPEPQALDDVSITEEGIVMLYEANFGGNTLNMIITAHQEAEGLAGTIAEVSGLFTATFTAERRVESETAQDVEERERRRRPASTQTKLTLGENKLRILFAGLKLDSGDYEALTKLEDGEVFSFVLGRATKLFTDVDMTFPNTVVKEGNAASNYPGVYSLWLKKVSDGWHLVFNEECDVWGTQYNVDTDANEIHLNTEQVEESVDTFKVNLAETDNGGTVTIAWGTTRWTAAFTVPAVEVANVPEEGNEEDAASTPALSSLQGEWTVDADSQIGPLAQKLVVNADGTSTFESDGVASEITDLKIEDGILSYKVTIQGYSIEFEGTVTGDELAGDYIMDGNVVASVTGTRVGSA